MTGMAVAQRMTPAEYMELDGPRWSSLVDGEIVVNQPRPLRQDILFELAMALRRSTSSSTPAQARTSASAPSMSGYANA